MSQRKYTNGENTLRLLDAANAFDEDAITSRYSTEELAAQAEAEALVRAMHDAAMKEIRREEWRRRLALGLGIVAVAVLLAVVVYEGFFSSPQGMVIR